MIRIGLVSDTHGRVDAAVLRLFEDVSQVWHAGDHVDDGFLDAFGERLVTVRGNNDVSGRVAQLPEDVTVACDGLRVLVRHIVGTPSRPDPKAARRIEQARPHLVLFGHSHRPSIDDIDGRLFVNPGSAGPQRFKLPRSAGVLELDDVRMTVRITELGSARVLVERTVERRR